jgi:hypothetical protein
MNAKVIMLAVCVTAQGHQASAQPAATSAENTAPACSMCNAPTNEQKRIEGVNDRGALGMGFSQKATTHHFLLRPQGGFIQVEANVLTDVVDRDEIRRHLAHIAKAFGNGNFDIPMFVHAVTPPGVPAMKRLKGQIDYSFEETPNGGRVKIQTSDAEALDAVHEFLRFQIQDHKTGDPLEITQ